jgi:hypothetical protein
MIIINTPPTINKFKQIGNNPKVLLVFKREHMKNSNPLSEVIAYQSSIFSNSSQWQIRTKNSCRAIILYYLPHKDVNFKLKLTFKFNTIDRLLE